MGIKKINIQVFYPDVLKVTKVTDEAEQITINLKSMKHSHNCPGCNKEMLRYHGTYTRTVQDLPILGKRVSLSITAYEYKCFDDGCEVKSFVEDYDGFVGKSGRMTYRLEDFIRTLALETNCEGAAAICKHMGINVSGSTIIRLLMRLAGEAIPKSGDTIGVDDFAYRKGHTYCTVICDGESHRPIEILKGRDGETLKKWLAENKHIKKVTRDRAGAYAKAITDELPEAMQIADRFHLHQNLLKAVKEALKGEIPNKIPIPNTTPAVNPEIETVEVSEEAVNGAATVDKKKRI